MQDARYTACLAVVRQMFGADANADLGFYDLGGNSLDAIQLTVRLKEAADLDVNAYDMVNADSLAGHFRECLDDEQQVA